MRGLVYAAIGAVVVILILLLGTAAYFVVTRPPTLGVSRTTVSPGDSVIVTASHVPHNQVGNIELHSVLKTYPFKADGNGDVKGTIFLPNDLELGTHTLRICWNGACRAQVILHVVAGGLAQVSPGATPLSGSSPVPGSSPNPGSTPAPGSTPTSRPVGGSSPTPARPPSASPTPTHPPSPVPSPTPSPSISLVAISSTGNTSVTFHYYYGGSATVTIHQGGTSKSVTVSVAALSTTTVTFKTPSGFLVSAPPVVPQAYVTVGSLKSNSVNVTV